jgi:hypothetical protein
MLREAARRAQGSAIVPLTREQITSWFQRSFGTVRRLTPLESRAARSILTRYVARLGLSVRVFVFKLVDALDAHARALEALPKPRATQAGVERRFSHDRAGTVWAVLDGQQITLGTDAVLAWVLADGRFVAWSGTDGAGGYENEGQSLHLHDTLSGKTHKVMSERYEINRVSSHLLSTGRWALLVEMSDGAVDGDHFAVVNPERGETFFAKMAIRVALEGDLLTLGYLPATQLVLPPDQRIPNQTQTFDLKTLLEDPLVVRTPTVPPR